MLITFEGIDCCGKSTQARLLAERLQESGRDVLQLREPGNTPLSEHIRETLLSDRFAEMNERAELLLFAASRAQLVGEVIIPALELDRVVICDRFYDSTVAYQGYGRQLPLEEIVQINRIATQGVVPDMTFYVDVPPEVAMQRCGSRIDAARDRMEESGVRFYERVIDGYMRLAYQEGGRFYVIDGTRSIDEVHDTIWRLIVEKMVAISRGAPSPTRSFGTPPSPIEADSVTA